MPDVRKGKIILIRHGETEANRLRCFADSDGIPLNGAGRRQAHELARFLLRSCRPQALFSSSFLRARQTSEILESVLNLTTQAVPGLHERDFGCLRGLPYERMGEMMPRDLEHWMWSPEGGESLDEVRRRAIDALESLRVQYPGQEILVVCHGAVIQAVCAHITRKWSEASVPPNCGFVTIAYDAKGWDLPVRSGDWETILHAGEASGEFTAAPLK